MTKTKIRNCPICNNNSEGKKLNNNIEYKSQAYSYYSCLACKSVFVDPVPSEQALIQIYKKYDYHDCYYIENKSGHYETSAKLLTRFATTGALVLDYGCGFGYFLCKVRSVGFNAVGVEFDAEVAKYAKANTNCDVWTVSEFFRINQTPMFDVIHLGDVLEHLAEPVLTLEHLLKLLKPGGLLFVEGPLEINPSPVYWATRIYGALKHLLRPNFIGQGKPMHLFKTGQRQQLKFFHRVDPCLKQVHWEIHETGWPYANSGRIKSFIANLAMMLSGKRIGQTTFGNRFTGIFSRP